MCTCTCVRDCACVGVGLCVCSGTSAFARACVHLRARACARLCVCVFTTINLNLNHLVNLLIISILVLRAKVIKDRWQRKFKGDHRRGKPRYDILVSSVWKGHQAVERVFNASMSTLERRTQRMDRWLSHIYTSPSSCTVPLEVNTKYVLTGIIVKNKLYMTNCHWRTVSNKYSRCVRKLFKSGINCNCEIQSCYGQFCNQGIMSSCLWDLNYNSPPCRFRVCRKQQNYCEWSEKIEIDICHNLDNS